MQKNISRLLVSNPFFTTTLYTHSIHLQDTPLDLWYSLRQQPTTQMQDTATQAPHPRCSLSSRCPPHSPARIPQFPPHTSAPTLHNCIQNYLAQLLAQRKKISTTSQVDLKTEPLPLFYVFCKLPILSILPPFLSIHHLCHFSTTSLPTTPSAVIPST